MIGIQLAFDGEQVLNLEEKVDLLSADVEEACSVEDILVCEDKLQLLDEENGLWQPDRSREIVKKMKDMNINNAAFEEYAEAGRHDTHATLRELAEKDYGAGRMRLDYREGRLLMHTTVHPADGYLSFQVRNGCLYFQCSTTVLCLMGRISKLT